MTLSLDENEYFSDEIDLTSPEFEGFDRRPVSRLNQYDKMTIGKLSNNISNEYLDAVTSILQEHRYELKNAIAKILLRGYNDTDGMRIIDIPDQETFDNLELYLARVSHIPLTSTIENSIKDLSDDTNFIHVVLLKTCDPTEDDYGPVYIPLFKIRSYKFTPMEDFDGNNLQETYIDYPKNVSFRTMVKSKLTIMNMIINQLHTAIWTEFRFRNSKIRKLICILCNSKINIIFTVLRKSCNKRIITI